MPDLLFTYYIENPLVIMSINSQHWGEGVIVIKLDIEIWVIGKDGTKKEGAGKGLGGEEVRGLLGFVALVCVYMYLCCCSCECLC
jgi:hypothetical protein